MGMPFSFRRFLFVIAVIGSFCHPIKVHAQIATNTDRHDTENIYYQALKCIITQVKERPLFFAYHDTIFIDASLILLNADSLISKIDSYTLIVLGYKEWRRQVEMRKEVMICRIDPLEYRNKEFRVSTSMYSTYTHRKRFYSRKQYWNGYGEGYHVYFKFENGVFRCDRVKLWGI